MKNYNDLLIHACKTVPYYRKLGIAINPNISFETNLQKFPILKRQDLCNNEDEFISDSFDKAALFYEYTSGSSGKSIRCYKSIDEKVCSGLALWKRRALNGISTTSRRVSFYTKRKNEEKYKINEGVLKIDNELLINVLDLCDERLDIYLSEILKYKPEWIMGPISALYYLARYSKKKYGNKFVIPSLKYIESAGEISSCEQRSFISKVFKTPIADMYGCREIWLIGFREKNGFFKTFNSNAYVEMIPDVENEKNDIVITGLNSLAMPIIRYKVGDSGYYVGNEKKYFEISGARTNQYFLYKNKNISVVVFFMAIYKLNQIYPNSIFKFQFIRKNSIEFDLLFIPDVNFSVKHLQDLQEILVHILDEDLILRYIETQYIEFSNNGKLSYFVDLCGD